MADIINLFENENNHIEEIKAGIEDFIKGAELDNKLKGGVVNIALDLYQEALTEAGLSDGEIIDKSYTKFLTFPLIHSLDRAEDGEIPLISEKFGDAECLLLLKIITKEGGKDKEVALEPSVAMFRDGKAFLYDGRKGWEESSSTYLRREEAGALVRSMASGEIFEIIKKNDATSDLIKILIRENPIVLEDNKYKGFLDKNKKITELANRTMGFSSLLLDEDDQIALMPIDGGQTGILIKEDDGELEVCQCILPQDSKKVFGVEAAYFLCVGKTKDIDTAERIFRKHIDARKGMSSAITLPLSLSNLICITPGEIKDMAAFIEGEIKKGDFTAQEIESAESFIAHITNLKKGSC